MDYNQAIERIGEVIDAAGGGLKLWPDSSSKTIQPPRAAAAPLPPATAPSRQAVIAASPRAAARRAGTCTLQPIRCNSRHIPARVYSAPSRRQVTSVIRASVQH